MIKVFFIGCSHIQLPYLQAAKDQGFYVLLTDADATSPGRLIADEFHQVGYTDVEKMMVIAQEAKISPADKVFTASAQFANDAAAKIARDRGIEYLSVDLVDLLLNKSRFYSCLESEGLPYPVTHEFYGETTQVAAEKVYYLKSDYGKSPNYCYRIEKAIIPVLPSKQDCYYRGTFLLQEEVKGEHYRLNLVRGENVIFRKYTDQLAEYIQLIRWNHRHIVDKLKVLVVYLGLENYVVKFDLVVDEHDWWILDIGIDPPMRMRLLSEYVGINFPSAYVQYYLRGVDDFRVVELSTKNKLLINCDGQGACKIEEKP